MPEDIEEYRPAPSGGTEVGLLNLMSGAGLVDSNSEARRLIKQDAVSIDGEKVNDTRLYVDVAERAPFVLKVGKRRYVRVIWNGDS